MLASARLGELDAADCRFVLLIAYLPMDFFPGLGIGTVGCRILQWPFWITWLVGKHCALRVLDVAFRFEGRIIVFFCLGLETDEFMAVFYRNEQKK